MIRPEDCSIDQEAAVDRHGIHEFVGPLIVGGVDFLTPRTALFCDSLLRPVLADEQRFRAYLQFREQASVIAVTELVSAANSPVDLFLLADVDGKEFRSSLFGYIMQRHGHRSIIADYGSNGSEVYNISTIYDLPKDQIQHYENSKVSILRTFRLAWRYFGYRKGLLKLDFIQSSSDPEDVLKRLKSSTGWSELQDHELRRCLESHMDLLKEPEMTKINLTSRKSSIFEYENIALEKINSELSSELEMRLSNYDWMLMEEYYDRMKLRSLARECATQAQTNGFILVEEALPVREEKTVQQIVKQSLEARMGYLGRINEKFRRGARCNPWQLLAFGTLATVATVGMKSKR